MKKKKLFIYILTILLINLAFYSNAQTSRVIVVGFDGLGSYAIPKAHTPTIDSLLQKGAYSLKTRAVLPTSSGVNWASHLMGAGPEVHGYTTWYSKEPEIASADTTEFGMFPTIFYLLDKTYPNAYKGAVYSWKGLNSYFEEELTDFSVHCEGDSLTTETAIQIWTKNSPQFMLVHFDDIDHVGHDIGHATPEIYRQIEKNDQYLNKILSTIRKLDQKDETTVILISDHGGIDATHGGKSPEEVFVPWVISGPGIKENYNIKGLVINYDTSPTIAKILNLTIPDSWRGSSIDEVFK
ncbi:alkaline phosphatase [Echinicola sediminis]